MQMNQLKAPCETVTLNPRAETALKGQLRVILGLL